MTESSAMTRFVARAAPALIVIGGVIGGVTTLVVALFTYDAIVHGRTLIVIAAPRAARSLFG